MSTTECLKEEKFLKVLSCRTSRSNNKNLKMAFEKEGTNLYYKQMKSGWELSTKKISDNFVPVRAGKSQGIFTYIKVKDFIDFEGDVALFRTGKHSYAIRPATEEQMAHKVQPNHFREGDLKLDAGGSWYMHLNRTRANEIYKNGYAYVSVTNSAEKAYIELRSATNEEINSLPDVMHIPTPFGGVKGIGLLEKYEFVYKRRHDAYKYKILIPISFAEMNGTDFMVWQREDGMTILEPNPLTCSTCGKKISRYKDKTHKGYTCNACNKILPKLQKLISESEIDDLMEQILHTRKTLEANIMK